MLEVMSPKTVRLAVSALLDERGMSTAEFAKLASLSYNQALALRRGNQTRIDLETIERICNALGVLPGDLIIAEEQRP